MNIPCKIKALKYISFKNSFEMYSGHYAQVTLEEEQGSNSYRTVRISHKDTHVLFTEAALENAIKRGDFEIT